MSPRWADDWLGELLEAIQKQTRAAAKQSTRLESALGETDARVSALAELIKSGASLGKASASAGGHPDEVFDALDALDEALRLVVEPHLAEGLVRVHDRLTRFCERVGYTRVAGGGKPPDPRLMRIVGTEARHDIPRGEVTRVVRAALVAGSQLVREGEVIVSTEVMVSTREDSDGIRLGN